MGDLVDEDLEFRGGTLQLSSESSEVAGIGVNVAAMSGEATLKAPLNQHPSVLCGVDSLSTSTSSFSDPVINENPANENANIVQTVYPRYDMPFSAENIKDFFTYRNGIVEAAIQECVTGLIFPDTDGDLIGSWLLTEITLWDNEKERLLLLTTRMVITIKYDFIAMKKLDFKKTLLSDLDTIVIGELEYPPSSIVPVRNLRGIRLMWNKGQPLSLKTTWNPFSQDTPFLTFASHPVYWHKGTESVTERSTYDMESFAQNIVRAVEALETSDCCIHHSPIVIQSYVGVTSLLHNKNSLGFFKVRGKFSF